MIIAVLVLGVLLLALGGALVWFVLRPFAERMLALSERKVAIRERPRSVERETIPVELVLAAMQWRDEWARLDSIKRMEELYEETGSWDGVRAVLSQRH